MRLFKQKRNIAIAISILVNASIIAAQGDNCLDEGNKLIKTGKFKDAVRILEKCGDDPASWELLGTAYFELNYMDDAKDYLKKAIEKDPDNLTLKARYADAFAYNKEFSKAVEEFRALLEKNPNSIEVKKGLAQALGWSKKYDESIVVYREIVKADPSDYDSRIQIAVLTSWKKKFPEAVEEFRGIIGSKLPKKVEIEARLKMAEVISWQKKLDESVVEYDKIIAMAPESVDAYLGKGTVLEWKGAYKDARKQYEKALQIDSQNKAVKGKLQQLMWVK
ncbi:MAG: tetratricopeptide repeat protein [Fibrobacter sp.]|nr:tetratricopeptide repeat protein [Fibrobacter sp.]